jgi:PAS domain S-box-containing protein
MLDPTGIVTNWNPGAERFKGYSADEIVGQHFSRFYTEEDRARDLPQQVLEIAEKEGKFEAEGWRVRKDGSRFWAHVVIDPVRGADGSLIGFAKITRDLTERRESQLALEQAKEALFQSQKTEAIGRLTGGIAHDFNNLLAAISGSVELIKKRATDAKILAYAETAGQAAKRGAALTQRMLVFARRHELKAERIEVASLVNSMADLLQRFVGPDTTIQTRFPLGLPAILADPNQFESALLNLVVNARDAIKADGIITIGARCESGGGDTKLKAAQYVCVCVSDNGEGMDDDVIARAAEPFFTTKGVGKGTGLGLSMVQGLVEESGGKMTIDSTKGEGTTVELCFPAALRAPAAPPAKKESPPLASSESLRVLAVDDDALVLMNLAAMLEDLGHQVEQASSGPDALNLLKAHPDIQLVITDQAMPKMTGLMLAESARKDRPDLPVILATGYADLPDRSHGYLKLDKPYFQSDLIQAIGQAMAQLRR